MTPLEADERKLFTNLIEAAGVLATAADNAAVILSEEFEEAVRGPIDNVRAVLATCPVPEAWNGELLEEDLFIEAFRPSTQESGEARGVRVLHVPTGISRESYSKHERRDNEKVAREAVAKAVHARAKEQGLVAS
jgi:hypothetical protein